jgi:hypothetical protein
MNNTFKETGLWCYPLVRAIPGSALAYLSWLSFLYNVRLFHFNIKIYKHYLKLKMVNLDKLKKEIDCVFETIYKFSVLVNLSLYHVKSFLILFYTFK